MKYKRNLTISVLLTTFFLFSLPLTVKANTPANMVLAYDFSKQELNVTITHNVATPSTHYIATVEIRVNGSLALTQTYTSQPTTSTFMYQYNITAGHGATIQVLAICNISGSITRSLMVIDPDATPSSFTLTSTAGSPDSDGAFDLTWTTAYGADNYSVFSHISFITEINGSLTTLANQNGSSPFSLSGFSNGTYYFIVRAYNLNGETDSNVLTVVVLTSSGNGEQAIPGYGLIWLLGVMFLTMVILIKKKSKKS